MSQANAGQVNASQANGIPSNVTVHDVTSSEEVWGDEEMNDADHNVPNIDPALMSYQFDGEEKYPVPTFPNQPSTPAGKATPSKRATSTPISASNEDSMNNIILGTNSNRRDFSDLLDYEDEPSIPQHEPAPVRQSTPQPLATVRPTAQVQHSDMRMPPLPPLDRDITHQINRSDPVQSNIAPQSAYTKSNVVEEIDVQQLIADIPTMSRGIADINIRTTPTDIIRMTANKANEWKAQEICRLSGVMSHTKASKHLIIHRSKLMDSFETKVTKAYKDLYVAFYNVITARASYQWMQEAVEQDHLTEAKKHIELEEKKSQVDEERKRLENKQAMKAFLPVPHLDIISASALNAYNRTLAINIEQGKYKKRKLNSNHYNPQADVTDQ